VESDYYDWSLEQRAERLKAPKIDHLCKTILFENTKWKDTDHSNPRYLLVVVQYVDKMNAQKLMNFVRDLGNKAVARKWYNMRVASEEKNREMTGFEPGGVTPFGTSKSLPIIVTENITKLDPPIIYLGAGHKDWKVCIEVKALIRSTKCFVADLQQDTPSETVA
ncbi:YbaK/aminoacyl-tRNA synthetase-associated domain-containing protein, partial [Phlyctochytrium arcticum]